MNDFKALVDSLSVFKFDSHKRLTVYRPSHLMLFCTLAYKLI